MSSYDIEHSVAPEDSNTTGVRTAPRPRRPDFTTFFSHVDSQTDTSATINPHAQALPSDISAAYRLLAEGFERMRQDRASEGDTDELLDGMIEDLLRESANPPTKVHTLGQEFLDELDRVPRKQLKPEMQCPICSNDFLDDPFPLVVSLPCNPKHMFDLECIAPWLKLNSTCPLDRIDLAARGRARAEEVKRNSKPTAGTAEEEEEEEWNEMFA